MSRLFESKCRTPPLVHRKLRSVEPFKPLPGVSRTEDQVRIKLVTQQDIVGMIVVWLFLVGMLGAIIALGASSKSFGIYYLILLLIGPLLLFVKPGWATIRNRRCELVLDAAGARMFRGDLLEWKLAWAEGGHVFLINSMTVFQTMRFYAPSGELRGELHSLRGREVNDLIIRTVVEPTKVVYQTERARLRPFWVHCGLAIFGLGGGIAAIGWGYSQMAVNSNAAGIALLLSFVLLGVGGVNVSVAATYRRRVANPTEIVAEQSEPTLAEAVASSSIVDATYVYPEAARSKPEWRRFRKFFVGSLIVGCFFALVGFLVRKYVHDKSSDFEEIMMCLLIAPLFGSYPLLMFWGAISIYKARAKGFNDALVYRNGELYVRREGRYITPDRVKRSQYDKQTGTWSLLVQIGRDKTFYNPALMVREEQNCE